MNPLELKVVPLELPTGKLGAAHFRTDGCVPLLDEKNELIELLADILDYGENAKERGETAVLFGNSSSSGSPEHNRELSLWRGNRERKERRGAYLMVGTFLRISS